MSKTITDIIPPSRRRQLDAEAQARQTDMVDAVPSYDPGMSPAGARPAQDFNPPKPPAPPPPPKPLMDGPPPRFSGGRRSGFPYITAGIAAIAVLGSTALLIAYAQARVTITPKMVSAPINQEFTATRGGGQLPFEIVTVEKTATANVPAESSENANDPATGTITILNAQAESQTLIKNTRFESPQGLIYRIQESVTIPGGSPSSPGRTQVTVFADAGGANYNIPATTFTVPGLKGSSAFELVTAKSDAPMTGGFSGTRASVGQATRDREQERLKPALETSLREEILAQLPAGYIVLPGSVFVSHSPARDSAGDDNTVNVNLRGTATAIAFPEAALARAIAPVLQGDYAGEAVSLGSTEGLTLTSTLTGAPAPDLETFPFTLGGEAIVVWDVDPTRIAGTVAGKDRDAASAILESFPEVGTAQMRLTPPWRQKFPSDPADIAVATTSPTGAE